MNEEWKHCETRTGLVNSLLAYVGTLANMFSFRHTPQHELGHISARNPYPSAATHSSNVIFARRRSIREKRCTRHCPIQVAALYDTRFAHRVVVNLSSESLEQSAKEGLA